MKLAQIFIAIITLAWMADVARGQSSANVLVVINEFSAASIEVGSYYAERRGIPSENVVRIRTSVAETIERADFERQIESPLGTWLTRNVAQDRILYIVLTKGIPLRISGTLGQDGTTAAVDSELTLLYRKLTGQQAPAPGRINNPYFHGDAAISSAKSFIHEQYDIFLVSRLDGYDVADIRALIDRGMTPSREGAIVLDDKQAPLENANIWLKSAADALRSFSPQRQVIYDSSNSVVKNVKQVLGYYSWGSNDPAVHERHFGFDFVKGALAAMFVSTDARTFNEPPSDWKLGTWDDPTTQFSGSPQSLAGDFIRDGVTGVAGHVSEPYLDATIRPNILFPAYLSGASAVEAFYLAMPYLSWQTVVIGDPLCSPFGNASRTSIQIHKGLDPITELPVFYSSWRLKILMSSSANPDNVPVETVKILMRADARAAKQDLNGMRQSLEQATEKEPRLGPANLTLGLIYDQAGEYDNAIERYRRVLDRAPEHVVALNNLAFDLAAHRNAPKEALPLAEKAYTISNRNPNVTDTLAWVLHLSGDDLRAGRLLAEAVQAAPQNASIRLHAAIVYATSGNKDAARQELTRTLELDPKLASTDEVQELELKLK
jgi:uncharacterized protein (TIGR03790 family)